MINWRGVFPAITTKFTENDQLDLKALDANIKIQMKAGINGLIIGGSLGEASSLTDPEKETLSRSAVEMVEGKIPVILTVAEQSTKRAIRAVTSANKYWG